MVFLEGETTLGKVQRGEKDSGQSRARAEPLGHVCWLGASLGLG